MVSQISSSAARLGPDGLTVIEEYRGLSTDIRPILPRDRNGSTYYNMDDVPKKVEMWDGENLVWLPQ